MAASGARFAGRQHRAAHHGKRDQAHPHIQYGMTSNMTGLLAMAALIDAARRVHERGAC
jgi:hypothetical protein